MQAPRSIADGLSSQTWLYGRHLDPTNCQDGPLLTSNRRLLSRDNKGFCFAPSRVCAEDTGEVLPPMDFDVIALDDALEGLQQMEPRLAQVIELHYFGGMTYDQIAAAQESSAATVHRDIRLARAWLLNEISGTRPA